MTRSQAEKALLNRCGGLMSLIFVVDMDHETMDGTNESLAEPIAVATRAVGGSTEDPSDPTTAEVEAVAIAKYDEFLDRAELRLLENITGNWKKPNARAGIDMQEWGRMQEMLMKRLDVKAKKVKDDYGIPETAVGSVTAGVVDMDFQELFTDDPF